LPAAGLQTNGYSLARKLFFEVGGYTADSYIDELGATVGKALLETHQSFLPQIGPLLGSGVIKGLAHITGGGFLENIPRILPEGVGVQINRGTWPVPPIFGIMQELGNVPDNEMFRTFNMGIGMIVVCAEENINEIIANQKACYKIGKIEKGNGVTVIV
jgi:phosphoribosylformylglycinamidine cyclo-ligase